MLEATRHRSVPGVLFVEDFDQTPLADRQDELACRAGLEQSEPSAPTTPGKNTLSDEELEQIKSESFADGYANGLERAEGGLSVRRTEVLERMDVALDSALRGMRQCIEDNLELIANTALCLLAECLPAFCERLGDEEMLRLLRLLLPDLADEPKLTITVSERSLDLAGQEVARLSARAGRAIIAAADLHPGDLRVTWPNGTAHRDVRMLRDQMLARLADHGLLAEKEATL